MPADTTALRRVLLAAVSDWHWQRMVARCMCMATLADMTAAAHVTVTSEMVLGMLMMTPLSARSMFAATLEPRPVLPTYL